MHADRSSRVNSIYVAFLVSLILYQITSNVGAVSEVCTAVARPTSKTVKPEQNPINWSFANYMLE